MWCVERLRVSEASDPRSIPGYMYQNTLQEAVFVARRYGVWLA